MKEKFQRVSESPLPPVASVQSLTDPEIIATWLPILSDVTELERLHRYSAVLEDRVGPFRMRANVTIHVTVSDEAIAIVAEGQDRQIGSRISFDGLLRAIQPDSGVCGSQVQLTGSYEITGRAGQMGASKIRKKADAIVDGFASSLREFLAGL